MMEGGGDDEGQEGIWVLKGAALLICILLYYFY